MDPTRFLLKVKKREKVDLFVDWFGDSVPAPSAWAQRGYTINYATSSTTGTITATAPTSGTYDVPYYWSSTT